MAKKKNRNAASRRTEHPNKTGAVAGVYPISTGEAELVPDGYHSDGWLLLINGVQSSHVIVGQPRMLDFEYMRWIAAVLDSHIQTHLNPEKLRITHLGGGACSLARYCADVYPNSRNTVVELDAKLAEHVRDWFDIPKSPRVKIRVGDAGTITRSFAPASRDVVIRDVFAVDKTPVELTSVDFVRTVDHSLVPGGLYILNCGDDRALNSARAEAAALRSYTMKVCPSCEHSYMPSVTKASTLPSFCSHCGLELFSPCKNCGEVNFVHFNFCWKCGAELKKKNAPA